MFKGTWGICQVLLSWICGKLATIWLPPWLRSWIYGLFIRKVGVCTAELAASPKTYRNFQDFFSRSLKQGVHRFEYPPALILSPADGTILACGKMQEGSMIHCKGVEYSLRDLLGQGCPASSSFSFYDGCFCTIYLHPRDYHRYHLPMDAVLETVYLVPGKLGRVGADYIRKKPRLYGENRRVVCGFRHQKSASKKGRLDMYLILVGALNVGSILLREPKRENYWRANQRGCAEALVGGKYQRGQEFGRFALGSTIILCIAAHCMPDNNEAEGLTELLSSKIGKSLRVGEPIGYLRPKLIA